MINYKSIPFLKILLPYLIGILTSFSIGVPPYIHVVFLASFILWLLAFIFQNQSQSKGNFKKWLYIILTNVLLCVSAFESCFLYNAKNDPFNYCRYVTSAAHQFIVTINDIPVTTEKFIKIPVEINSIELHNRWHYANGNTIIYLKNDAKRNFSLGNQILVNAKFGFVSEPKNPHEFDYRAFLENRNIFHTVYANPDDLVLVSNQKSSFSVLRLGTSIKIKLVSVLRSSNLSQEAFSICSALLVGYDDEIDSDIMQSFSHSGTLHILSVSGMHTGVLYGILVFVFSLFDKYDRFKKIKFLFVIFFLMLFVFVTGLSPSVLRAALMLCLVLFGKTFYKQGNGYNTLLLSAFLLLLFNPYLIKDVGFLLSYLAVFGIMYLYPLLNKLYTFNNRILQWLWTSVLISISATLFTLPVSLYFFHQFPIWFIFSNLLIIPISMVIMIGAALLLITYKIAFLNYMLAYIINACTTMMLWLARLTDNTYYGFIDSIPFSEMDLVFMTLLIALFLILIAGRHYRQMILLCSTMIIWLSVSIYDNYMQMQEMELIIFYFKRQSVVAVRAGQTVYTDFNTVSEKDIQRHVKPYLLTISNLKIVQTKSNVIKCNNQLIVKADRPGRLSKNEYPQYIVVSNDTPIELITNYKTPPIIIADCTNSYKFVKKLKRQCALAAVSFYWIKEKGSLQIKL